MKAPEPVKIRPERGEDSRGIAAVHVSAFANHPLSQQTEHLIVDELRAATALAISLVAEMTGRIVGHIAFSLVTIEGKDVHWYALGPVGVLPELQGQGIGSSLVRQGLKALQAHGAAGCVLLGEPEFYSRFGFRQCRELTMEGVPAEAVLCLPMVSDEPHGHVEHHPAFWVQPRSEA
jgi:putative acetyltransferase